MIGEIKKQIKIFKAMKLPSKNQCRQFFKVLSKKEKVAFFILFFLFLGSSLFLSINFYFENTEIKPADGGIYIEGLVGFPRFLNPVYAPLSDVDRDLVELIYSGLMKYNSKGEIIPDLAKEYKVLEGGEVFEFYLKENLFWQDGKELTADDIIFTVKTIQNPAFRSPLRGAWLGLEIEKISERVLRFRLRNPSAIFLENCTLKILPKHIWKDVSPENFPLVFYNLKPIGSGPYQVKDLFQAEDGRITSLNLIRNRRYYGKKPYLLQIIFHFFENEEDLIKSYFDGAIKGFSLKTFPDLSIHNANLHSFSLPRYFAIFFNPGRAKTLEEKKVRQALNYGINKEEIITEILKGKAQKVDSPILPEIYGFEPPLQIYQFNPERAKEILEEAGFTEIRNGKRVKIIRKEPAFQFKSNLRLGSQDKEVEELQKCLARDPEIYPEGKISGYFGKLTKKAVIKFQEKYSQEILEPQGLRRGTGEVKKATQEKLNAICFPKKEEIIPLEFSLATINQPVLIEVARILASQWQNLGVKLEIETFDRSTLEREIIKPRNYELLLFGKVLGLFPDPFPFWHSSQKRDPGLNLALFENKESDKLLEEVRQSQDLNLQKEKLEKFQNLLIAEAPAVFLYNPNYLYFVSKEIKGIKEAIITEPSKRFINIQNWYIETKRAW